MQHLRHRLPFLLVTVTLVQVLVTMSMLAVAVVAPMVARSTGISPHLVGYQVALTYAFCSISSNIAGGLVRRWGACRLSQIALALAGLGCLVITLGRLELIAVGSAIVGMGYGMTNPAASHLLFRFTPAPRRNLVFSLKQTGVPLGGVVLGLSLPGLAEALSWQVAIGCVAVMAGALAVALNPLRADWDDDCETSAPLRIGKLVAASRLVWDLKPIRWLGCCGLCFGAVQMSFMSFAVTLLVEDFGYRLVAAGVVLSFVQAAGACGRIFWGVVADRLGGMRTLIVLGLLATFCAVAIANLDAYSPPALVITILVLFGGIAIGWNGVAMAEIARLAPPGEVSVATGGTMAFSFIGVVIGPGLFSTVFNVLGTYTATFGLLSIFSISGVIALIAAIRALRREEAALAKESPRG